MRTITPCYAAAAISPYAIIIALPLIRRRHYFDADLRAATPLTPHDRLHATVTPRIYALMTRFYCYMPLICFRHYADAAIIFRRAIADAFCHADAYYHYAIIFDAPHAIHAILYAFHDAAAAITMLIAYFIAAITLITYAGDIAIMLPLLLMRCRCHDAAMLRHYLPMLLTLSHMLTLPPLLPPLRYAYAMLLMLLMPLFLLRVLLILRYVFMPPPC